jgi:hypothetical protein
MIHENIIDTIPLDIDDVPDLITQTCFISDDDSISINSIDDILYNVYLQTNHHDITDNDMHIMGLFNSDLIYNIDYTVENNEFYSEPILVTDKTPDYEKLRPYFMNLPTNIVQ